MSPRCLPALLLVVLLSGADQEPAPKPPLTADEKTILELTNKARAEKKLPALTVDPRRYVGAYERPGTRFEVDADGGRLRLTSFLDPMQAEFLGREGKTLIPVLLLLLLPPGFQ